VWGPVVEREREIKKGYLKEAKLIKDLKSQL